MKWTLTLYSCPVGGWVGVAVEYTDCTSAEDKTPPNEYPAYDSKQSDGEVPVMLELWGMQITPSFSLLPAPLWPKGVALDRALSMGQIELTMYLGWIRTVWLNWIAWNRNVFD